MPENWRGKKDYVDKITGENKEEYAFAVGGFFGSKRGKPLIQQNFLLVEKSVDNVNNSL